MKQEIAKLRKEKAAQELKERRAKYQKEGIANKEVRKGLRAIDVRKNKACAQLNNTSYHASYIFLFVNPL